MLYCRTRHSHSSSYTHNLTVRRHWTPETCEFKSPSLLLVSTVQLYCVLLRNCTNMVGGWIVGGWRVLLLYSCTAVAQSCCYSCPPPPVRSVDRAIDRAPPPSPGRPWAAVVDRPPSSYRSLARSPVVARPPPPPSLGRPFAAVVARPPSPARSLTRRRPLARRPSLARRRSPAAALVTINRPCDISRRRQDKQDVEEVFKYERSSTTDRLLYIVCS